MEDTRPIIDPGRPLDREEIKSGLEPGSATIKGQAFAKTRGGDVKYGAGNTISLLPMTPYVEECYNLSAFGRRTTCGNNISDLARTTIADGSGNFAFESVKPGRYLVSTEITWNVGYMSTGGDLAAVVIVPSDNSTVTAIVHER
jgi:hypothetical protein